MPLLAWGPKYSVDVEELDVQHQRLFAIVNELYDAMRSGCGRAAAGPLLDRLIDYTSYHFASEEALFREHGYPEHAAHRAEHAALAWHAKALRRRLGEGEIGVAADTLGFLMEWLDDHVLGSDMKYRHFLNDAACGNYSPSVRYPSGLRLCQRQVSAHISPRGRVACHPSSSRASAGSA